MSQEGNIWRGTTSFLTLTHVICVCAAAAAAQHRLSLSFSQQNPSVEARLHCGTWRGEVCRNSSKAALSQTASSWSRSPSLTHLLSTIQEPAAGSAAAAAEDRSPLSSCGVSFLPSIHPSVSSCLWPLQPLHTSLLNSSFLNLCWSLCLSVFSPLLSPSRSLPVLVRACWWQIHLQALWTQLTFSLIPARSAPFALSFLFFLVPVTPLIERAALRPGNECSSQFKTSAVQQSSAACAASNSGSQELNVLTLEALQRDWPVCHRGGDDWHVNRFWIAPVSVKVNFCQVKEHSHLGLPCV